MKPIATYVFFDLGTTGLRDPKIRELHMIAVRCEDLRKYFREGEEHFLAKPPAQKLHCRIVSDLLFFINQKWYGYEENSLKEETARFLEDLEKPVCLIAHNGNKFDFPLLKEELADIEIESKYIVCADSMHAFYDIFEPDSDKTTYRQRREGSFPWPEYHFDKMSYRLEDVYKRVFGFKHMFENAKDRNIALAKIALNQGFEFMLWVAENYRPLSSF
ncbi:three-prime repair exonuclease 1-like [Leguminivora glycinivorella]|uniref:three-prime repair exonuclease 1-like n=1 Tax=Leguminivora glycinivorella TaxID=1035111 RepID=UPI00200D900D|nr:three-prime repair exonuclease 1-like [Leguminivora glycinivorella]